MSDTTIHGFTVSAEVRQNPADYPQPGTVWRGRTGGRREIVALINALPEPLLYADVYAWDNWDCARQLLTMADWRAWVEQVGAAPQS